MISIILFSGTQSIQDNEAEQQVNGMQLMSLTTPSVASKIDFLLCDRTP